MSSVLFLFLGHLGIGIAVSLLLVSREAGVQFFRFNSGLAAVLLLVALAFRPETGNGSLPEVFSIVALGPSASLTALSFISSAALLGGSCTSMILGHWYLVLPSMNVSLLQRLVKFHIGSTIVRIVVVGLAITVALSSWESPSGAGFDRYMYSIEGIFLWQRVLFGLLGPLVLSYLTWETAKIQSTQSATGILYVDFFTVIVGEVLAKYLLVSQRVPL